MLDERQAYLALSQRLTPGQIAQLVEKLGTARAVARLAGCSAGPPEPPHDWLTPCDPDYPARLLNLHAPPAVLYYRGRGLPGPDTRCVAVVGTRRASAYGLAVATRMGRELARSGVTVISGLARGIDAAAHRGSLEGAGGAAQPPFADAGGARGAAQPPSAMSGGLAVLGCGLGMAYPPEHARLKQELETRGAVVSEYPGQTPPLAWHFPARNRIVAALAEVVVVVEAPLRSGALITVNEALSLGREVMVVPGPVGARQSEGSHALIREGAQLVRDADDVLEGLSMVRPGGVPEPPACPVLEAIPALGCLPDELSRVLGMPVGSVLSRLTLLEMSGRARRLPEGVYVRS